MRPVLVSNYASDPEKMAGLDELGMRIFGISFVKWKEQGLLGDNYIPYSFFSDGKVISNVSANLYTAQIYDKTYEVVQIGTVMTDPDYRGQGLAARLMRELLSNYYRENTLLFLFANASVLAFYPKFGFVRSGQKRYVFDADALREVSRENTFRKLDWAISADRELFMRIASDRTPISRQFGLQGSSSPRMIYLTDDAYNQSLYYSESRDIAVCMSVEKEQITVHDIFLRKGRSVLSVSETNQILADLLPVNTTRIVCDCMIDTDMLPSSDELEWGEHDALFVLASEPTILPGGALVFANKGIHMAAPPLDLCGFRVTGLDHT